jgi:hypothetical protein
MYLKEIKPRFICLKTGAIKSLCQYDNKLPEAHKAGNFLPISELLSHHEELCPTGSAVITAT